MTYSLVVRDGEGNFGVVTASKSLAVGATVPALAADTGALVTQAHTNTTFAKRGIEELRAGCDAAQTVDRLIRSDPGRSRRQLAVLASTGEAAVWTGSGCTSAAGHLLGPGCVAVGNCLSGTSVLSALRDTFLASTGTLPDRLIAALAEGEKAGGDHRGKQSAALRVVGPADDGRLRSTACVDLRVDDHLDPVGELRRLLELHHAFVGPADPVSALPLTGEVAREVAALLEADGSSELPLEERLAGWAHNESLEHRLLHGLIDLALLNRLRTRGKSVRRPGV
ncbi:DUF1028 domain-containing protein [Streptomyces sp. WMMB 322]|uniref:DUF1028 domain-containing protein n=1 Tax=Streptomyces sp. WMMB 322 TaxID=1286821 RepID=UPI0006E40538|nr:DUF1028 domain-containing protein [Streptomyces sp. WMMB 322]SCK26058.1 Uncharacterized conserved protein, Ntn-hydrolase superfamily [Streptomyces sp. WMMB 322]